VKRTLGVILVGDRGAEDREDAVAGTLYDVAIVVADGVDHQLQCWVNYRARLFGIKVLHQFRRSFDVGDQRGDGLALAVG
jgi:hypothetical protein